MLRWLGPLFIAYSFYTAYLDRRSALGRQGHWQLARRFFELTLGVFVAIAFGTAVDDPAILAGSPWVRFLLVAPAFYGVALAFTGLLHLIHLLYGTLGEPYRVGWILFWIATGSLVLIVVLSLLASS